MPSVRSLMFVAAFVAGLSLSPMLVSVHVAKAEPMPDPCGTPSVEQPMPAPPPAPVEPVPEEPAAAPRPNVRLSELFPDPVGTDTEQEFIELENRGDTDIELVGWELRNASGKSFTVSTRIAARGHYSFTYAETKLALVNGGMTLTLVDAQGAPVDTVTYPAAKEGKAYARKEDGTWQWTSSPTPGMANQFDPEEPAKETLPEPPLLTLPVEPPPPPPAPPSEPTPIAVSIQAFMPDPVGDDAAEWIRLANAAENDAVMDGWKLDDDAGGSGPFALAGTVVPARGTITLPRSLTKLALNNDADAVRLLAPDGAEHQRVEYVQPPEGKTYEMLDGRWLWTPVDEPAAALPASTSGADPGPTDGGTEVQASDIADLEAADESELLMVEAQVTVPPGVLGKRTFAVQQKDGGTGMFVRAYGRDAVPALAPGDLVRVTGRARRERGTFAFSTVGRRIEKFGNAGLSHAERTVDELGDADEGLALAVTGVVVHRGKATLAIADEAQREEVEIRLRTAGFPGAVAGAKVTVRGTVRMHDGRVEMVAFAKDAVSVLAAPAAESAPADERPEVGAQPAVRSPLVFGYAEKKGKNGYAVAAVLASCAAGLAYIVWRRWRAETMGGETNR